MEQPTSKLIEQLERIMQQRRTQLLAEIAEVLSRIKDHPYADLAGVPDPGDASMADLLIDVDNAMVHRDVQEVREIDAAFGRIEEGRYGLCSDCGAEIDEERLVAVPTAMRCFRCQDQYEKTHVGDGTPSL